MGKTKGINNAEFEVGSEVKIADRAFLEAFLEAGQYHNELEPEQLAYRRQNRQSEGRRFLHRRRRDLHAAGFPACGTRNVSAPPSSASSKLVAMSRN